MSSPCRTTSRIASPSGVPPGSRVETTSWPCSRSHVGEQPRLGRLPRSVLSLEADEHRAPTIRRVRAAVTGGAGFIGSNLVDALVARGDDGRRRRRPLASASASTSTRRATLVERDIRDGIDARRAPRSSSTSPPRPTCRPRSGEPAHDARGQRRRHGQGRSRRRSGPARGSSSPRPAARSTASAPARRPRTARALPLLAVRDREALRRGVPRRLQPDPRHDATSSRRLGNVFGPRQAREPRGRRGRDLPRPASRAARRR